jgi:pyruvate,orthophosphate dikinase
VLAVKQAAEGLSFDEEKLLAAATAWHEVNPMIGVRGVRLGVIKPGLYAMQARALMEAVVLRKRAGGNPLVEIMIPLVVSREELALAKSWVVEAVAEVAASAPEAEDSVEIGTMIETPRAALRAEEIAEEAEFFSFGTNDLTQMTFGFSRDDIEARIMAIYLELGLLKANPFDTVDTAGVGELIRLAATRGRTTKTDLKLGICGEHGGDPASIEFFARIGVNYVSCSPFRVPVARLAAAQALTKIDAEKH